MKVLTEIASQVRFLGGSSTLVLGSKTLASQFFSRIAGDLYNTENLYSLWPEAVVDFSSVEDEFEWDINESYRNARIFLEYPREILYQTLGKKICFGGNLIFCLGVTEELVEKYNNQDLTPPPPPCILDQQHADGATRVYGCEMNESEYLEALSDAEYYNSLNAPEYPQFDEFGNPTVVSWLSEYALRAEDFSQSHDVDMFLNLEWNKSKDELPTPFWLLFDRIYELTGNDNEVKIIQLR